VYNSLNGSTGGNNLNLLKALDAGPDITVTDPNGSQNIPVNGQGQTVLGPGTFLSPGSYTLTGTGGADIGRINVPFTILTPPTLTSPTSGPNVPVIRANGITFTWSGGTANSTIQIQGGNSTDNTGANGATFTCFIAASAGTFTIPPSVLLALPPGTFAGSVWDFSPYTTDTTFSASGLNHTEIRMSYAVPVFTTLQ
jgi:hypothetical protein